MAGDLSRPQTIGKDKRVGGAAIVQEGEGMKTLRKRNGVEVDAMNHVPNCSPFSILFLTFSFFFFLFSYFFLLFSDLPRGAHTIPSSGATRYSIKSTPGADNIS